MHVACYSQFFCVHSQVVCILRLHMFSYPNTDARITHHVFVRNRNKLVLEMLTSSSFTCDEGELRTGEFQPRFH